MPSTPAERRALLFLSGLLCLGVAVRAAGAVRREPPPAVARAALARQIDAVDSARKAARASKAKGRGRQGSRRRTGANDPGGPARPPAERPATSRGPTPDAAQAETIDLDTASTATLERLPRIGPALAKRIVEDRERNGAFGSLEGFQRVRGVGPALARLLAERVTFSGSRRHLGAAVSLDRAPR